MTQNASDRLDVFSDVMKASSKWGNSPVKLMDGIKAETGSRAIKALETGGDFGRESKRAVQELKAVAGAEGIHLKPSVSRKVDVFKDSFVTTEKKVKGGKSSIPTEGQMHDAVMQWARMKESLANSKTQLSRFNTASVVYDSATGNYFYGMNRGIQLSGDNLNSLLKSWLPEKSFNDYKLGNCAEVDAINQALNSGADINVLYMYTINTNTNLPKPMCENCSYTFLGRVKDVLSH